MREMNTNSPNTFTDCLKRDTVFTNPKFRRKM